MPRTFFASAALLFSANAAHAAGDSESKAAARELAVEGIQLAQNSQCAAALPKLVKAEQLYHAPTILLWQGDCEIQLGRVVEGTEHLNQLTREQLAPDAPDAFHDAQTKAAALLEKHLPRIARLTIEISPAEISNLKVTVNGKVLPEAMIGAPRPTDPGAVEVRVSAPGYREVVKKIALGEAARESLPITLEVDTTSGATPPAGDATPPTDNTGGGEKSSVLPTLGWIGVGTGAAALAAGGVFGFMAIGAKGDLVCPNNVCSSESDVAKLDEARSQALVSTILFATGGVLAAAGVTLLIVDGGSAPTEARVTAAVLPGGAAIVGRF